MPPRLPRLPAALLNAMLPRAERREVLSDMAVEFHDRRLSAGVFAAHWWVWRQLLHSTPALLRRGLWRGWTGFEPNANRMTPGGPRFESWLIDLRIAARRLRSRPTYAFLAIVTLTLGVGGAGAMYGIARGLLFDPLPFANEREIAQLWSPGDWSDDEFLFVRGQTPGLRTVAAFRHEDVTLRTSNAPARVEPGIASSYELFDVLGTHPIRGRAFERGDDAVGAEPVAVLSWGLWQELGGDESTVGSRLVLDGKARTVVGVMPRGFWFPDPSIRVWLPLTLEATNRYGIHTLVGWVDANHTVRDMQPQLLSLARQLRDRFRYVAEWDKSRNPSVAPIRDALVGDMRPALYATLGALAVLLLIACANVAALMLGQVSARTTELAVRSALGATRSRLMQQLVIESLLLGVCAGSFGALLAGVGFRTLARALPLGAWGESASPDWRVFAAAMVLAVAASTAITIIPVLSLFGNELRGTISRSRARGLGGRGSRFEEGLVVAEVALAVLLASGATLLVRSVANLYAIRPGVVTNGAVVLDVVTASDLSRVARLSLINRVLDAMHTIPGVQFAATTQRLPMRGRGWTSGVTIDGKPAPSDKGMVTFRFVTPEYFSVMGMQPRDGRLFDASDAMSDEPRAVINESFARKFFAGTNPIGQRIGGNGPPERIIGVVSDAAEGALKDGAIPARYLMASHGVFVPDNQSLVLRTSRAGDEVALLDRARRELERVAPDIAIQDATTMQRVVDIAVGPARQLMQLLSLLSALALTLGAIGIYGVIAHFVSRRHRDWAIRMALGLTSRRVVQFVVGRGAALVVVGIGIGVAAVFVLTRILGSFLFGVSALDPLAVTVACTALLIVGVFAAFIPARRAGMVDPALSLREQ